MTAAAGQPAFNPAYIGSRDDVLGMIPASAHSVLDVGCSVGALGRRIKETRDAFVAGVELDPDMAEAARRYLDAVVVGNASEIDFRGSFPDRRFDCVVFADVLEHLADPWTVLRRATEVLSDGGVVVSSIPNIRHYTTIGNLLFRGYWPYRDRGIHDRTHLRFFTLRSIRELFRSADLEIVRLRRMYRIIERPHRLNKVSPVFAWPGIRDLLTFQYLVAACRASSPPD